MADEIGVRDPFIDALAREAQLAAAAALEARDAARVYQLAFWPDDERAMPGDFIACALFTASRATNYVRRYELASLNGLTAIFTGRRLTQVHADVWLGIMHLARTKRQGDVVWFRSRELLTLIGRHTQQTQREQLLMCLSELAATELLIQDDDKRKRFGGSLLPWRMEQDEESGTIFAVEIHHEIAKVLSGNFWKIDWETRKRLLNKPLALWLQTYFARFSKRPVSIETLHSLSGSTVTSMRKFRQNLAAALADLAAVGGHCAVLDRANGIVISCPRTTPKPRRAGHEGQVVLPFVRP